MDQSTDQTQLLLHSAGEVLSLSFPKRFQIGKLKEPFYPFLSLLLWNLIQVSVKMDVFKNAKIPVESKALRKITDPFS